MLFAFFQVGCVCNNAVISGEILHGQPTEGALLAAGMKVIKILHPKYYQKYVKVCGGKSLNLL